MTETLRRIQMMDSPTGKKGLAHLLLGVMAGEDFYLTFRTMDRRLRHHRHGHKRGPLDVPPCQLTPAPIETVLR